MTSDGVEDTPESTGTSSSGEAPTSRFDRDDNPSEFGRVLALSDGVFAIALTLLVLDIALPAGIGRGELVDELRDRQAGFIAFGVALFIVGSAWFWHHWLFSLIQAVDGKLLALNVLYLGCVVLIPFAQSVQAGYPEEPLAYVLFAGVLTALLLVDAAILWSARAGGLLRARMDAEAFRIELLRNGISITAFLASMPLAYVLGPFTVLVWLATMPVNLVLGEMKQGRSAGASRLRFWQRRG